MQTPLKFATALLFALAVILTAVVVLGKAAAPLAAQAPAVRGPFVGPQIKPVSFDVDLRALPDVGPTEKHQVLPLLIPSGHSETNPRLRGAIQGTNQTTSMMPAPSKNFPGLDYHHWGSGWPPDANGDVGPNNYIQAVNTSIGAFKKTGTLIKAITFNQFFTQTQILKTPCYKNNKTDPIVLYDTAADRWVITDLAFTVDLLGNKQPPFYECIGVSKTGNPLTGGWWQYAMQADSNHTFYLNDYPKLAVWPDAYYMSANMWDETDPSNPKFVGVRVWALNRGQMLNGNMTNPIAFDLTCGSSCYSFLLPSNYRGTPPPSGSPDFFASVDPPTLFHMWKFHVDWANPSNSTFTGPTDLTVADFAEPCTAPSYDEQCVPEANGEPLDAIGDRLMMQLQYRNIGGTESLWANHTVARNPYVGAPTGIRWYEIRNPSGTPMIYQQGTYLPDSTYRWMGSLAVDKSGDMALGYSVSNLAIYPAIRYVGRLVTDTLGKLPQGERSLTASSGAQQGGGNRWGDYTSMTIDPTDDCTFWYTDEYYATNGGNWQTRIGSFKFPSCGGVRITEYPIPTPSSNADGIMSGSDGNLWFSEAAANQIGRITTGGAITEFPLPTTNSYPEGITTGPDGNLWFTEAAANQIGRITTGGAIAEFSIPTPASEPVGITTGPDGNLWFAEYNANQIGRLTP